MRSLGDAGMCFTKAPKCSPCFPGAAPVSPGVAPISRNGLNRWLLERAVSRTSLRLGWRTARSPWFQSIPLRIRKWRVDLDA